MPSTPATHGVFRAVAPTGYVAVQIIDSTGAEFARLSIRERAFDPALLVQLLAQLEAHDPTMSEAYMLTLLRSALPSHRGKRRGR